MDVLVKRDQIVRDLSQAVARGGASLENVPGLLRRVLKDEMWKERLVEVIGEIARFDTWAEFVSTTPPEGLGTTPRTLRNLCRDDEELGKLLDRAEQRPGGRPRKTVSNVHSLERPAGNARGAGYRRLEKHRPDLLELVIAGELTVNAAMIQAGFRRKTITVPVDVDSAERALRRYFSEEDIRLLAKRLAGP